MGGALACCTTGCGGAKAPRSLGYVWWQWGATGDFTEGTWWWSGLEDPLSRILGGFCKEKVETADEEGGCPSAIQIWVPEWCESEAETAGLPLRSEWQGLGSAGLRGVGPGLPRPGSCKHRSAGVLRSGCRRPRVRGALWAPKRQPPRR